MDKRITNSVNNSPDVNSIEHTQHTITIFGRVLFISQSNDTTLFQTAIVFAKDTLLAASNVEIDNIIYQNNFIESLNISKKNKQLIKWFLNENNESMYNINI